MKKSRPSLPVRILLLIFTTLIAAGSLFGYNDLVKEKIYRETPQKDVLIGLWSTPPKHAVPDQASMDRRCEEMYRLGARMLITLEEQWDMAYLKRLLNGAEKYGIKVLVYVNDDLDRITSVIRETRSHPAVMGYYLKDEPLEGEFRALNKIFSQVKNSVPENFLLVGNLLPDYGVAMIGGGNYKNYVSSFYETVPDANAVFFDSYIYRTTGTNINSLLYTLAANRAVANEKQIDMYPILQAASWGIQKTPSVGDLRFQANLALLFGSAGFTWYYYWIPYDMEDYLTQYAMVTYDGEKTAQWDAVQTVNQEIHKMKGVFLDYEFQSIIPYNISYMENALRTFDYIRTEYKELKAIQGNGNILIGCFEKEGKTGLYAMNLAEDGPSSATLQLDGIHSYQIWNADGLSVLDRDSEIPLQFGYGEGCFITIE